MDSVFNFTELEWTVVSPSLREFIEACLQVDVSKRIDIQQLKNSRFLKEHNQSTHCIGHSVKVEDEGKACYQTQVSSVIHEIVHRQATIN